MDASTGVLTFVQARNFESRQDVGGNNVYDVVVSVSDGVNTDIQALRVAISNVNEGVTLTGGQPYVYYIENGTAPVADFNATDADGDPVTYSLSGADAARFTIDAAGVLRFAASPNFEARLDAGANNVYDVSVTASDGSLSSSYALSVEVLNQNEAPFIVSGGGGDSFAMSLPENSGFVTTIVTADPDANSLFGHLLDRRRRRRGALLHLRADRPALLQFGAQFRGADRCRREQCLRRDRLGQRRLQPRRYPGDRGHDNQRQRGPQYHLQRRRRLGQYRPSPRTA